MGVDGSLSGRVALVTGASRGIGADVAKYLARAGAAVVVCARTEEQQNERLPGTIHTVAQEISDAGGQALAIRLDMRDLDSIESAVDMAVQEFGGVAIIVNNAAVISGSINTKIANKAGGYIELKSNNATYGVVIRDYNSDGFGHISTNDGYLELGYNDHTGPVFIHDNDNVGIDENNPTETFSRSFPALSLNCVIRFIHPMRATQLKIHAN